MNLQSMIGRTLLFSFAMAYLPGAGILKSENPFPLPFTGETPRIMVDQFGFLPDAPKVAIFADPVEGFNNQFRYTPGDTFEVRNIDENRIVFTGPLQPFRNGEVDPMSGDRVWWADFSTLRTPGTYRLVDPANGEQSYPFRIAPEVYAPVLKAAGRMFYYNRSGIAKEDRFAGPWTHGENHRQARYAEFFDTEPRGRPRDVSGGWWDAGDYNKYVRWTGDVLADLFLAYASNPGAFGDDWGIPESGNGVPDLLDELRWELEWLLKMQDEISGGVYNIAGTIDGRSGPGAGDPANAELQWYYSSITTWSTASFAAATAHGSRLLAPYFPRFSACLLEAARRAWQYLEAHPEMDPPHGNDTSNGKIGAGQSTGTGGQDERSRLLAAAELFRTTGEEKFHSYFLAHHLDPAAAVQGSHPLHDGIFRTFHGRTFLIMYLVYTGADVACPEITAKFHEALRATLRSLASSYLEDGYRNDFSEYWWGSSRTRACRGYFLLHADILPIPDSEKQLYRQIANEYLHYFHGRNPLNIVYLTNMGPEGANAGASRSVRTMFHYWFAHGTQYDGIGPGKIGPAPGYVVGGPNQYFSVEWLRPPFGQPPGKSFLEFSSGWNASRQATENSWEITEPAIYYQSAYLRLLAPFVPPSK